MKPHILIPDSIHPKTIDRLKTLEEFHVTVLGKISRSELIAAIDPVHAMIIRSGVQVDAELLEHASNLKVIVRGGVGVDNIDVPCATQHGVAVMNTPSGNTIATAEHTLGMILALARHIPQGHASLKDGKWNRKAFMGSELAHQILGVIGFGRIGRAVAKRALAFDMQILAFDPYVDTEVMQTLKATKVTLDELYAQSDWITLHTALTDETRHMLNASVFDKMKEGVRIVNAARGTLIHDDDLAQALASGRVGGVALDVYVEEPPPSDHPLIGHDRVIHTPHLAASTHQAQEAIADEAAELVIQALIHHQYHNLLNPDALKQ